MKQVSFYDDCVDGRDCVLLAAISGTKEAILEKLKGMVAEIESPYGKPYQGCVSAYKATSHVITPTWNGQEY